MCMTYRDLLSKLENFSGQQLDTVVRIETKYGFTTVQLIYSNGEFRDMDNRKLNKDTLVLVPE